MNALVSGDLRVLVVDDSAVVVEVVRAHLERAGLTVSDAGDVAEALAAARGTRPDLLLLDVNLPSGSGLDVLRELRSDPALESMLVVMVTRESDPARVVEALELGADDFLRKPFEPAELIARLHAALRRRRPAGAGSATVYGAGPVSRAGLRAAVVAAAAAAGGLGPSLLAVRIDRLRDVNRNVGEFAGDQLVAAVAAELAGVVGPGGTVGRLSGATLAVVTPGEGAALAGSLPSTFPIEGGGGARTLVRTAWLTIDPARPEAALTLIEDALDR